MDIFETKLRGFHARAVENIMARTVGVYKNQNRDKSQHAKPDNITTYLRKFEIDRENLNLAKRILLCESEHNHKKYKREWKKTKNFIRVRSNFKRSLVNEEPKIYKFQPILGNGNILVSLRVASFEANPINFRPLNLYMIKALVRHSLVDPTNNEFTLETIKDNIMAFYIPYHLRKKEISFKIVELKENNVYEKGKFKINPSNQGESEVQIINKSGKVQARAIVHLTLCGHKKMKDQVGLSLKVSQNSELLNEDERDGKNQRKEKEHDQN